MHASHIRRGALAMDRFKAVSVSPCQLAILQYLTVSNVQNYEAAYTNNSSLKIMSFEGKKSCLALYLAVYNFTYQLPNIYESLKSWCFFFLILTTTMVLSTLIWQRGFPGNDTLLRAGNYSSNGVTVSSNVFIYSLNMTFNIGSPVLTVTKEVMEMLVYVIFNIKFL